MSKEENCEELEKLVKQAIDIFVSNKREWEHALSKKADAWNYADGIDVNDLVNDILAKFKPLSQDKQNKIGEALRRTIHINIARNVGKAVNDVFNKKELVETLGEFIDDMCT